MTPTNPSNTDPAFDKWWSKAENFAKAYGGGPDYKEHHVVSGKSFGKNATLMGKTLEQLANGSSVMVPAGSDALMSEIKHWAQEHGFTAHFMDMETKAPHWKVWFTQNENATIAKMFGVDVVSDSVVVASGSYVIQAKQAAAYMDALLKTYSVPPTFIDDLGSAVLDTKSPKAASLHLTAAEIGSATHWLIEQFYQPTEDVTPANAQLWAATEEKWNVEVDPPKGCPCFTDMSRPQLQALIQHLNDKHKWSYEKIADWLDTLDNQPVFYPKLETESEERISNEGRCFGCGGYDCAGSGYCV